MQALKQLVRMAPSGLEPSVDVASMHEPSLNKQQLDMLGPLYTLRNGCYAYGNALHVYPIRSDHHLDVVRWNDPSLWKFEYGDMAEGILCFAEDVFGGQFCVAGQAICCFDPETGEVRPFARSIDEWAGKILRDPDVVLGYSLALDWQERHGAIIEGSRLIPKRPFIFEGEYSSENLYMGDAAQSMGARGWVANGIRDLPDGTQFQFTFDDELWAY